MNIQQVFIHYHQDEKLASEYQYCPICCTPLIWIEIETRSRKACPACNFIQYRNPAPSIAMLIADGKNVLLGKRRGNPGRGKWALPSGYVDFEEDFLTAALREAKEETGLDVNIRSILNVASSFVSPEFHFLCIYLFAKVQGGELQAGDDLEAVQWFPVSGPLPAMSFEEDRVLLELYAQNGANGLVVDPRFSRMQ